MTHEEQPVKHPVEWKVMYPTRETLQDTLNLFEMGGYTINKYEPLDEGNFWIVAGYKEIEA